VWDDGDEKINLAKTIYCLYGYPNLKFIPNNLLIKFNQAFRNFNDERYYDIDDHKINLNFSTSRSDTPTP
jgi:hypothetical protein